MGVVQAQLAIAHQHQQRFAVVGDGYAGGIKVLGGRDELLHAALFGVYHVEASSRALCEEVVQPRTTPDRCQTEVVGFTGRGRDEYALVVSVVGLHHQGPAHAAEGRHVATAGVAEESLAAFIAVQDVAAEVHDFGANWLGVRVGV